MIGAAVAVAIIATPAVSQVRFISVEDEISLGGDSQQDVRKQAPAMLGNGRSAQSAQIGVRVLAGGEPFTDESVTSLCFTS